MSFKVENLVFDTELPRDFVQEFSNARMTERVVLNEQSYSTSLQLDDYVEFGQAERGFILNTPTQLFYNTVYFDPKFFQLGNVAQSGSYTLGVWNAFLKPIELSKLEYDTTQGVIIHTPLNRHFEALEFKVLKVDVDQRGSPLIDILAKWSFDNGFRFVLPITGTRTIIVGFIPDKEFAETLRYKTEISQSRRKELRAKMASNPIRTFSYSYHLDEHLLSLYADTFNSAQSKQFLVPTWQEMQLIPEGFLAGSKTFDLNQGLRGYKEGEFVIVWEDEFNSFVSKIEKIENSTVHFKDPINRRFEKCFVMPCKQSTIQSAVSIERTYNNNLFKSSVTFTQNDIDLQNLNLDLHMLNNEPVFNTPYSKGDITSSQKVTFINDTFTQPFIHIEQDKGLFTLDLDFVLNGVDNYHKWLDFYAYCSGKFKAFWLPTRFNDLVLNESVAPNQAFIELKYPCGFTNRNAIEIKLGDKVIYRKIRDNALENGKSRLILEDTIPFAIDKSDEYRISLMYRVRMIEDEVSINHLDYFTKSISFGVTEIL